MESTVITWPMVAALIAGIPSVWAVISHFLRTYTKGYDWVKHQQEQDGQIQILEEKQERQNRAVNRELRALTSAMLACLQGLHEQGCNGPVTKAISDLQDHINQRAHE